MNKIDLFLAVRCSYLDGFDPIDEVETLMASKPFVWFGKYGEPLGSGVSSMLEKQERRIFVVLIEKQKATGLYKYHPYRLLEATKTQPKKRSDYPKYYKAFIDRIGQWLRLAPYDGPAFELQSLVIKSSAQPLQRTLHNSMRGHFLCRLGP